MGGFYGSVQVRGADRDAITRVVEKLAGKMELRFLIGPELGGWVGVYPAEHGQDTRTGRAIARKLLGEVFHLLVHDDDFFLGLEGRLRYIEPRGGRSGVLLEPPGRWPINHIGLSLDRSAIGLTIQPDDHSNALYKAGPAVQFWNYPALSKTV